MSILAAIVAFLKAVVAACDFTKWLANEHRESSAAKRMEEKDAAVDAGVDRFRLPGTAAEQQSAPHGPTGLSGGSTGGPGVVPGRAENDQSAGASD